MAAETPVIEIRTLEAVKNVKELKENISALKAKIDDVNTSTDEYADLTRELSQNQAALRNVMNGTNSAFDVSIKDAQGLTTSYNSLVQQLKAATQEWRTIPRYLSEADQAQGKVNQAWTDAANRVERLRSELKDMDATTGNFTRNVGNYKSALDGFSGTMGRVQQIGGDMVNGISAAASSLSMLGIDTDGLTDSMKNLRIAVAAVQGAKGFAGLLSQLRSYFKAGKQAAAVTKEQTVATQAQTTAQNAANVATTEGAAAMGLLQKALIATGIGALVVGLGMLVAHLEDIVKWVGKVGEKFGLWKRKTDEVAAANKELNERIEEENRTNELQNKILAAQGVSQKTILEGKLKNIQAYIKEKNAIIAASEARLKEIEGHTWLQRVLNGENRERKKILENLKTYKEELKELKNTEDETVTDIRVEGIKAGQKAAEDAAKKAAQEAAERLKKLQEQVKEGTDVAVAAIKAERTEIEKLDSEFEQNAKKIETAVNAMKQLSGATANVLELEQGLKTLRETYYRNRYEAEVAKAAAETAHNINLQYKAAEDYDKIVRDVFGLTNKTLETVGEIPLAEQKRLEILKAEQKYLRGNIELTDEVLGSLSAKTNDEISKEFSEPLATAIKLYFKKSNELKEAGVEMYKGIFDGYEDAFQERLSQGDFIGAQEIANKFSKEVYSDFKKMGFGKEILKYFDDVFDKEFAQAMLDSDIPSGLFPIDLLFPQSEIDELKIRVSNAKDTVATALDELKKLGIENEKDGWFDYVGKTQEQIDAMKVYWEAQTKLDREEERLFKKRIDRFTAANVQIAKYYNTYGKATSTLMDNVADAWEAALQAQVKNGKKSEEEAKKSFGFVKALQLSAAVINTAGAVVQALADPTVPSYTVKAINAAAALAAGTAQVIKISSTEFSASASQSTESTPSLVDRTPQLQYTYALNTQDYADALAERPIKAYITDREVVEGIDQYNRRRDETSF